MTPQEQDQRRHRAWNRYKAAEGILAAHIAKFEVWGRRLEVLSKKMQENPTDVLDGDVVLLLTREEFSRALHKIRQVDIEFRMAKEAAIRFNWPIKGEK